jgi:hypothetical protein
MICYMDVATESRASTAEILEGDPESRLWVAGAGRAHGRGACTERLHKDVRAGPQRGRTPKRRGANCPARRRRLAATKKGPGDNSIVRHAPSPVRPVFVIEYK